jgi:hypothetical protein
VRFYIVTERTAVSSTYTSTCTCKRDKLSVCMLNLGHARLEEWRYSKFFNLAIRRRLVGWVGPRCGIDDLQTIVYFAPYGNRTTIRR